jgi:hypothetical protein
MFVGCKPEALGDPMNPPEGVHGPYAIAGHNRCADMSDLHTCRIAMCHEIIRDKLHADPKAFEEFVMQVYCFDDPKQQEQVM